MKAEIKIVGICRYGNTMFETEAEITPEHGESVIRPWTQHKSLEEAQAYRDLFNSREGKDERLRKSAPDLLQALKLTLHSLENWIEVQSDEDKRDYDNEAVEAAYQALNKAGVNVDNL